MKRRAFLAGVGTSTTAVAGCMGMLEDSSHDHEDGDHTHTNTPEYDCLGNNLNEARNPTALDFDINLYAGEGSGALANRERVTFENTAANPIDLTDHAVRYDSGREYSFSDLKLSPGSVVTIVSQGDGDSVQKSCPPEFIRDANFSGLELTDGEGTISLLRPDGTSVVEQAYTE